MTDAHKGNLEVPTPDDIPNDIPGEIPDTIPGEIPDTIPGDGGSGPSTESQILDDADLTDIPEYVDPATTRPA